ncbi:MAG: class I SAM-dependent methyltransferase [Myxococcales bacterium]|nr:class I SAM-dependent methyltransferase [Myxococcales bacterium]
MTLYDTIGQGYGGRRRADPRIASQIVRALGSARRVVNVGAGAGSYEPRDRDVVAVEPSRVMLGQRARDAAPAVRGSAMALPFRDASFDASLAILTAHHWPDVARGLRELRRVARERVVVFTFDTAGDGFWIADYFPAIAGLDRRTMPTVAAVARALGGADVVDVPVPHDCSDGFLGAYWRRPHAYLDASVRAAISVFARIDGVDEGVARLQQDLDSGAWQRRWGHLLERDELDVGYRLVVA